MTYFVDHFTERGKEHIAYRDPDIVEDDFVTLCGREVPHALHDPNLNHFATFTMALAHFKTARPGTTCRDCARKAGL